MQTSRIPVLFVAVLLSAALALAGCVSPGVWVGEQPDATQRALLEKQSTRYRKRGESAITGRAFLVTPDGREIPGAEEEVYLTPVTTWAEGRVVDVLASNEIPDADERAAEVWWVERADAEGRFAFRELVDGEYFLLSKIAYAVGGDADERIAFARVKVGPGETAAGIAVTRRIED